MTRRSVILEGARTPMRRFLGDFAGVSATELGAAAASAAMSRAGIEASAVDHVIIGNAQQTAPDAVYGARHVALRAGVPEPVPALTVNRLCGSGIQSVISAAQLIALAESDCVLAGGMENMSMAPHAVYGARRGFRLQAAEMTDTLLAALTDSWCGCAMSQTSDNLARRYGITRAEQDEYALRSQQCAAAAAAAGRLAEEIVPVPVRLRGKDRSVDADDHLRPDATLEGLAALPSAFGADSCVTAGNASGIVDGAAAVVVAEESWALEHGLGALGRVVSWAYVGVEPSFMGIGPAPATRLALQRAGWELRHLDVIEVNEAFAGQYLAVERELSLDRDKVNVNGGAIALGHPLGATGTRLIYTALRQLHRRGGGRALATACIGGGQGIAICLQSD